MAKKSKKKKKIVNKEFVNQIRHLEGLLNCSLRQVDGRSKELDDLFTNQANVIREEIKKYKESQ